MGGFGSGRRDGKTCTDEMRSLDVRKIARGGLLTPGRSFRWQWMRDEEVVASINIVVDPCHVVLDYRQRGSAGEWEPMKYRVPLDFTPCQLGGRRPWWRCPAVGCGRRVAVLFGGRVFACRHCHRLAYRCQRETDDNRATRRADVIRHRLGWEPGILNGDGPKPKGMHRRTLERLQAQHDAYVNASLTGMAKRLGLLGGRVEDADRWLRDIV